MNVVYTIFKAIYECTLTYHKWGFHHKYWYYHIYFRLKCGWIQIN